MSKDIKVGDWVQVKPGHVGQDGVEFRVTRVNKTLDKTVWGSRYADGDPEGNGIWFRFLEKIENPTAIAFLEMPVGAQFKVRVPGINYTDPTIYVRTEDGYRSLDGNTVGTNIDSLTDWVDYEILPVEDEPMRTPFDIVNGYRKELLSDFNTVCNEARPIRQAKLTAVGEILDRLRGVQ